MKHKNELWESLLDDFCENIQNDFIETVTNVAHGIGTDYSLTDKLIEKKEKEIVEHQKWPKIIDNELEEKKYSKEFESELINKSNSILPYTNHSLNMTKFVDLRMEFFQKFRILLWSLLEKLKTNDDHKYTNVDEVTPLRSEEIHFLETILRVHNILDQEQQTVQFENIKRKTRHLSHNIQPYLQSRTLRDSNIISEMIDEHLGRHNYERLFSCVLPHIHQIIIDQDLSDDKKELFSNNERQEEKANGLNHSEWKKRLINPNFINSSHLNDYSIESQGRRKKETMSFFPLSFVIETFINEFSFEWKKMKINNTEAYTYNGKRYLPFIRIENKVFQYYPSCHFCSKPLDPLPNDDHCCADATLLNLINKRLRNLERFRMLAAWKQSTLKKIAEKIENYKVDYLVEVIQSFLKSTAQTTQLSYGEIAKLLLAVAVKHQRKEETEMLKKSDSFKACNDPTEGIIDEKIESLWRKVVNYSETDDHSRSLYNREPLFQETVKNLVDEKERKICRKRKKVSGEENYDIYKKSQEDELLTNKSINTRDGKTFRMKGYCMNTSCKDSIKKMKDMSIQKHVKLIENFSAKVTSQNKEILDRRPSSEHRKAGKRSKNRTNDKDNFERSADLEQNSSSERKGGSRRIKSKDYEKDDVFSKQACGSEITLSQTSEKRKEGHEKDESCKKSGRSVKNRFIKKEAVSSNQQVKFENKIEENKFYLEEAHNKMSKLSASVTKEKAKSTGSNKNSKITNESKSAHINSVSFGKQIQKAGAKVFGFIPYRLSDSKYIECGWSNIPKTYHTKKVTIFGVNQGKKNISWCKDGITQEVFTYPEGSVFSVIREDGTGEIFYPNGLPAVLITKEDNRIITTVFSEGKANLSPIWLVGRFDSYGHGIIYDNDGRVRLQYTQTWGRFLDQTTRKYMKWNWRIDLKESVGKRSSKGQKLSSESKTGDKLCLGDEPKNFSKYIHCPIPFLTMKLNDAISFRLFEQHDVCLIFDANRSCFRIEIGVVVDFSREDFYESYIDHKFEKEDNIVKDMSSIHDELMPPDPKLPKKLSFAPSTLRPTEERRIKTLFLHRAIKVYGFEEKQS